MKKRIFALLVVLVFSLALFSCGKDEADYVVDALADVGSVYTESKLAGIFDADTTAFRISAKVDTLKGLEDYADLLGDVEVPDVADIKADFYIDLDKAQLAQVVSAKVDGKKMDLTATENLEAVAIKSSLLENAYGVDTDEFLEWIIGSDYMLSIAEEALPAFVNYAKATEKLSENYKNALKDSIRDNLDIDKEKNGKFLEFSFDISAKDASRILGDMADFISDDEALDELVDALGGDLGDFTDEMESAFDGVDSEEEIEVKLSVLKSSSKLVEAEVILPSDIKIEYEADEKNDNFTLEAKSEDGTVTVSHEDGKYEVASKVEYVSDEENYRKTKTSVTLEFADGEVTLETSNEYENSYYGEVSHDKQKSSVTLGYKIKGNTVILTLKGVGVNGVNVKNIDEKIGLTFEIEKNPSLPKMIKKFEELDDFDDLNEKVLDPIAEELEDLIPARHADVATEY